MAEDGKSKFTLSEFPTTASSTSGPPTSPSSASSSSTTEVETEAAVTLESNVLLPFAPTVLPKLDDYARRQKKISFLEKLKNSARNSLFKNKDPETQNGNGPIRIKPKPTTTTTTTTATTKKPIW